jgi:DNA-binding CsgD family transcriptional regulator
MPRAPIRIQQRRLVGRDAELRSLLEHARRPRLEGPGIAVVSGGAGMGKTALLQQFAEELRGAGNRVISVAARSPDSLELYGQLEAALRAKGTASRETGVERRPYAMGQRLLTAFTAAAADQPVTVVIDDIHVADVESLLALGFVTRRLYGQQLSFVLAVRLPEDGGVEPAELNVRRIMPVRGDVLRVRLAGLTAADIQSLAHAFGVIPFGRRDAEVIRQHSGGNPRHVARLLDQIRRDPHARSARPGVVLRSVTAAVAARVAELPEPGRLLLSALSVLGDRCPLPTAAQVAGVAEPLRALEPLLVAGLVEWWPAEPTTPVRIRSDLQQAVYQAIPPATRQLLHGRAAGAVPPGRALPHRMQAAPDGCDPVLAEELASAAWRWSVEGRLDRAAQYLLWAAELTGPGPVQEHRLLLGVSLLQRASRNEAAAALREPARACSPSPLRGCVLGRFAMIDGDVAAAQDLLESAIADLEQDPFTTDFGAVAAIGYTWLAVVYAWQGESELARHAAGRCLAVSPFGRRIDRGSELLYLMACCELEGPVAATERLREMAHLAASPSEVDPADAALLIQRGHLRLLTGEPSDAVADIETGLRTGRICGIGELDDWAHFWAAMAHTVLGSWHRAAEHAAAALNGALAEGRPHVANMLALSAYVAAHTGDLAGATEHAGTAAEFAEAFLPQTDRVFPAVAAAAIAHARDDARGVVEALDPFASWTKGWLRVYRWLWWPLHLDALLDLGRTDHASAGLAAMAADVAGGYRVLVVPHLYLAGRLAEASGDLPAAAASYQQAIDAPPALANPDWRARAAEAYRRITADQSGPEPQRLTARERAIAGLIVEGLSNRAVSRRLGIAEKTTEAHLTRVYRKLAVKSREELRAALHAGRKAGPPSVLLGGCARSGSASGTTPRGTGTASRTASQAAGGERN